MGRTKLVDVNSIILDTFSQTMHRYLQERSLIPDGQLMELSYDDFTQYPVETIRKTYATLGLNDFSYCENKMTSFAARQKQFKSIDHTLSPGELTMISKKMEPLISHWNYSLL
jgi:hypothetical protein